MVLNILPGRSRVNCWVRLDGGLPRFGFLVDYEKSRVRLANAKKCIVVEDAVKTSYGMRESSI